jgi:hypothetical protein
MSDINQAQDAVEKAKAKGEQAALDMFQLYRNLLSINPMYAWNKILHKKMASAPYMAYKAVPRKDPGFLCKSFDDCVMFHCLTVFLTSRLSRSSTTSQTCSRNPSASACVSLCSM